MEFRNLGKSDLKVSVIALGGNTFGPPRLEEAQSVRTIHAAHDAGVNYIDTANVYGGGQSEIHVGAALADRRDKWVIGTKYNFRNLGDAPVQQFVLDACETSLKKLRTDHIDLYQLHFAAPRVPEDEILRAYDKLIQAGKVRYVGASGHQSWQLAKNHYVAQAMGVNAYVSAMEHYNILRRQIEAELIPYLKASGQSLIPYFPLGGGFLTGKYKQGQPAPAGTRGAEGSGVISKTANDRNFEIVGKLETFAAARGHTPAELAIAWLKANPVVGTIITGVSNPEQVAMNVKAAAWTLTPEEKAELDAMAPRIGDDSDGPVGAGAANRAPATALA